MTETQVHCEKLSKHFGEVKAVDGIDLSVACGQFLTLLGPSGCGKTTLLRMIAGFEEPTSGRVLLGERDVTFIPPHKRPVNMVFQRYALFPHLSVYENVAFGLRVKGLAGTEIKRRVEHMLEMVQLAGYGNRRINQISGGQAQRVALARALVNEPQVLLLDEPLGALDLKIRQELELELKLLHAELGTTFVYVTHDQEEAMTISDRIVVMREGRIAQDGTPSDIYSHPANAFVAAFIGHSNILQARVTALDPVRLELLGQEVLGHAPGTAQRGQEVAVLIRPEALTVCGQGDASVCDNVARGRIVDATFKGSYMHYLIEMGGVQLKAQQPAREGLRLFARGDEVAVGWSAQDTLVLAG